MKKKGIFLLLGLLFISGLLVSEPTKNPGLLKAALLKAKPGDYVVLNHQKMFSLLHIFDRPSDSLILEEISAPMQARLPIQSNWQDWLDQGAPGHHAWVMYELDLETLHIQDIYSCSQKSWKKVFPGEQIFPTLLELTFEPVADSKRKRQGPPLPSGMIDDRPFWNPPIFFEGAKVKQAICQPYFSYWPNDGTELSGKRIEVYLAQEPSNVPHYFPVWMSVVDKLAQTKLRLLDSGEHLVSPYKQFPIPPLELTASQQTEEGELKFYIRSHPQLKNFKVYAKGKNSPKNDELDFKVQSSDNFRTLIFCISKEELKDKLYKEDLYSFIFEPQEALHLSVETPKPIKIKTHDVY